jgi:hypothetical protein
MDATLTPTALVATTTNVYVCALSNPVTKIGDDDDDADTGNNDDDDDAT